MKETDKPTYRTETKLVKHIFTDAEKLELGANLARAFAEGQNVEKEFDQVKAAFKSRTAEVEAKTGSLSTAIQNGFDMRPEKCAVVYRPKDRKKDYFIEATFIDPDQPLAPALTEDMTADDFQQELVQAESKFDHREELELFKPTESDRGVVVVGKYGNKWFSALRVKVGKESLEERLDSEQKAFKERFDAIQYRVKGFKAWAAEKFQKQADGFVAGLDALIEAHRERAE